MLPDCLEESIRRVLGTGRVDLLSGIELIDGVSVPRFELREGPVFRTAS